ncbi:DUF507 family protein [bacterium]|nr:DUF507 family protein [candidate division CSSED10-310 bacterium]
MRLPPSQIEYLASEIIKILEMEEFLEINDRERAIASIQRVIIDDLKKEDELDQEVREILEEYSDKMDQDRIQYHQMFKMVKEKLAKERNLIL